MSQPQDPRTTPLQGDEIAMARVLRALPVGEPSAKVDAAILAAATDAVNGAAMPAPRRAAKTTRWLLPGWAIGTAAAAVLAVGIGMQLRPPLAPEPQATSAKPTRDEPAARDAVDIELVDPQERTVPASPPPPESAPGIADRAAGPPPPPPPVPMATPAPPAPVAETAEAFPMEAAEPAPAPEAAALDSIKVTGTRVAPPPESGDHARRAHQASYATRAQREAAAKAEARMARAEAEADAREDTMRDRQSQTAGESAAPVSAAPPAPPPPPPAPVAGAIRGDAALAAVALPPIAEDAELAPREWLERIRERLRQGDRAGARASLHQFVQTHPDAPIPTDLDRLR